MASARRTAVGLGGAVGASDVLAELVKADGTRLGPAQPATYWRPPPSEVSPRFAALVDALEAGAPWSVVEMAGQRMLRVEHAGGKQMSALSEAEWATVHERFGGDAARST